MKLNQLLFLAIPIVLVVALAPSSFAGSQIDPAKIAKALCRLTTAEEFKTIFGAPNSESTQANGGITLLNLKYENGLAIFRKRADQSNGIFRLVELDVNGRGTDIGCRSKMILRNEKDFLAIDSFTGFSDVSLKNLDLRNQGEFLNRMPFDTLTEWPKKLPLGFDPKKILEIGKNPGLGIRALHHEGITGEGIGVAIIDQPLLLGHVEYMDQLAYYDASTEEELEPQMHSEPIASIAVGKSVGVAPRSRLYFFTSKPVNNQAIAEALEKIINLNERLPIKRRIRVVSVSWGGFKEKENYALWEKALKRATDRGIFVATCDIPGLPYLNLELDFSKDPDAPESYTPAPWIIGRLKNQEHLFVPGDNRTVATFRGVDVYQSERNGGLSWSAPYIAGLAALVFQVRPDLSPEQVKTLLLKTATPMPFGKIVNPKKLISEAREMPK